MEKTQIQSESDTTKSLFLGTDLRFLERFQHHLSELLNVQPVAAQQGAENIRFTGGARIPWQVRQQ